MYTVMHNDSTGQFEGGKFLEAASSLSAARFEGTAYFNMAAMQ